MEGRRGADGGSSMEELGGEERGGGVGRGVIGGGVKERRMR